MTAEELEKLLVETYGPDFRHKAIVGPTGTFFLRDCFAECGLRDPQESLTPSACSGLYQFTSSYDSTKESFIQAMSPVKNALAALGMTVEDVWSTQRPHFFPHSPSDDR